MKNYIKDRLVHIFVNSIEFMPIIGGIKKK